MTKELISYQSISKTPTQEQKKTQDSADELIKNVNEVNKNIRD